MAPTTAKLKHDIDRGRGGDKVDVIDLAVAPLGTDEEAAGTPPSPEAIAEAHQREGPAWSRPFLRNAGTATTPWPSPSSPPSQ